MNSNSNSNSNSNASYEEPVDPRTVSLDEFKARVRWHMDMLQMDVYPPVEELPPGTFRCFMCRRVLPQPISDEEAEADYARRFPGEPLDKRMAVCTDCHDILSESEPAAGFEYAPVHEDPGNSPRTHAICDGCWVRLQPGRDPARVFRTVREACCFCGGATIGGIYVERDPESTLLCCGKASGALMAFAALRRAYTLRMITDPVVIGSDTVSIRYEGKGIFPMPSATLLVLALTLLGIPSETE